MADQTIKIVSYTKSPNRYRKMHTFTMNVSLDDETILKLAKEQLKMECKRHQRGTLKLGEEFGKIRLFGKLYNYE